MKKMIITAAIAVVALGLAPHRQAQAADYQAYAGSGCKVFGSTSWTDLQFGARWIANLTATPKNIICPLIKDDDAEWDGGVNSASAHFHVINGNNTATTTCNVYVVESNGTLVNTYTIQFGGTPLQENNGTVAGFTAIDDPDVAHVHATVLCTLAAGAKLTYYNLFENGDTN